jgi:hypothetical protein
MAKWLACPVTPLEALCTGQAADFIASYPYGRKWPFFAASRKDRNMLGAQLRIAPCGFFESRIATYPCAGATSTHAPFPALRLALRQRSSLATGLAFDILVFSFLKRVHTHFETSIIPAVMHQATCDR